MMRTDEPVENTPPSAENDPHECPRRQSAGQAQIVTFLETGSVEQTCGVEGCIDVAEEICP